MYSLQGYQYNTVMKCLSKYHSTLTYIDKPLVPTLLSVPYSCVRMHGLHNNRVGYNGQTVIIFILAVENMAVEFS